VVRGFLLGWKMSEESDVHGIISERSQGLVDYAYRFARDAHGEQKRKYTGEPYINHPVAVAKIVMTCDDHNVTQIVAAILHDVIEDTDTTRKDIINAGFTWWAADMVVELSDVSKPEDGNRAIRKAMDRDHLAGISDKAKTVKLADCIHNSISITKYDPDFAKVYMREMQVLIPLLSGGNSKLFERAMRMIIDYYVGPK